MKKVYKIENLDCPVCAGKMQRAIEKIDGVESCDVSFLLQKITLEAEEEKLETVMKKMVKTCRRVEPDIVIDL